MSEIARFIIGAFGFVAIAIAAPAQNTPLFRFAEKPGPHLVGLKVVDQYDYSRTYRSKSDDLGKPYKGERARPLQTLIWYPAEKTASRPMTVGDYGNLAATETSFDKPSLSIAHQKWLDGIKPTLAMPMWAVRDAPALSGRFPVVIYAPSFSAMSWENADLCEYLASHGYVVIASPDMGASTRDMTDDIVGITAQARDISFLIGYAQTLPNTDMSALAVAGFSWGGISNLFAAARDNRIDALVALDGSMRYYPGLVKQGDVHPEQMAIPLLFFTQGGMTLEDQSQYLNSEANRGPSVLNAWAHGDLVLVRMLGLVHVEHSSMYQRNEDVWEGFPEQQIADYGREDGIAGYTWIARYTLHFLDAYLKHDTAAMVWLKKTPAENGAPQHFLSASYRPAKGAPATLESFRAELGQQGFDHAEDVYAAIRKESTDFKLDESTVNYWGYELMTDGHLPEAIDIFKLNVKNYPDSGNTYDSLGEAYMRSGQKQLAIESYNKSLEKDPSNSNATRKLKELGVHPAEPK
ncbi:tetratricopeptide repeat protein [Tunturiibacter gelidoferens]|uniref:Tetratricopeptide repeat protein n=1 Tax=Tunturiibacter gelidiferens TaxID=3069689 RepID=A0AAU7Z2U0_9BACT